MAVQLELLEEERRVARSSRWMRLSESVRRDVTERVADLIVAVVRAERGEEVSDVDEDQAGPRRP